MKVHPIIAAAVVGAIIGLQSWTLVKLVDIHAHVEVLKVRVDSIAKQYGNTANPDKRTALRPQSYHAKNP